MAEDRNMSEKTTTCSCYASDKAKLMKMKESKQIPTLADAFRICVEYAQSHKVFS